MEILILFIVIYVGSFIVEKINDIFKNDQLQNENNFIPEKINYTVNKTHKKHSTKTKQSKKTNKNNKIVKENKQNNHFEEILNQRNINYLIHFTNIKNIETILKYGICSRDILDKNNINYEYNDNQRNDDKLNCSCFSVEFPNNRFLYKLKQNTNQQYCIIVLDAKEILLNTNNKKYFFRNNAASTDSLKNEDRTTIESFKEMFDDYGNKSKYRNNLPDNMPTNLQSEILISGRISSKYIVSIEFENEISYNNCLNFFNAPQYIVNAFKNIFIINEYFFLRRSDACTIENNKTPSIKDYSDIHRKIKIIIEDNKPSSDNKNNSSTINKNFNTKKCPNNSNKSEDYLSKVKKGYSLEKIPYELLNTGIIYEALKCNYHKNILSVPAQYLSIDLFMDLIESGYISFNDIPKDYRSINKIRQYLLIQNIDAIKYIPANFFTKEICILALQHNHLLIKYFPEEFLTQDLLEKYIRINSNIINTIPQRLLTENLCEIAISHNSDNIKFIPERFLTEKFYLKNIENNHLLLKYIPEELLTQDFVEKLINLNSNLIKRIPERLLSEKLCKIAVIQNPMNIKYIPEKFLTEDFYLNIIENNYLLLKYIPEEHLTEDLSEKIPSLIEKLITYDIDTIKSIPKKFFSEEIYYNALINNVLPYPIESIPLEKRSERICKLYSELNNQNKFTKRTGIRDF